MPNFDNELIKEERSWWSRNWKWVVPTGGCLTIILLVVILLGTAVFGFVNKVKKSTGAEDAFEIAQVNKRVQAELGEPIEKDGFGSYNVKIMNGHKTAEAKMPIKGPKGAAILYVVSSGSDDDKTYKILEVQIEDTGEKIDLREHKLDRGDY
ncbi:MAG: cytochrome c oxidase assembly factor Coa1 family protein [Leeuwenhoekiella sp.]